MLSLSILLAIFLTSCLSSNPENEYIVSKLLESKLTKVSKILVLVNAYALRDFDIEEQKIRHKVDEIRKDLAYMDSFPPLVIPDDWNTVPMTEVEKEQQQEKYLDWIAYATHFCLKEIHDEKTIETVTQSLFPLKRVAEDEKDIAITLTRGPAGHFLFLDKNDCILFDATADIRGVTYFFVTPKNWRKKGNYWIDGELLCPEDYIDVPVHVLLRKRRTFRQLATSVIVDALNAAVTEKEEFVEPTQER